jgi:hypothetical protein
MANAIDAAAPVEYHGVALNPVRLELMMIVYVRTWPSGSVAGSHAIVGLGFVVLSGVAWLPGNVQYGMVFVVFR